MLYFVHFFGDYYRLDGNEKLHREGQGVEYHFRNFHSCRRDTKPYGFVYKDFINGGLVQAN